MLDHSCTCRSHRRRRRETPLIEAFVGIVTLLKADGDTEHSILEVERKSCSKSLAWVGGKIHCHLCSSADKADGTEEGEANTSAS